MIQNYLIVVGGLFSGIMAAEQHNRTCPTLDSLIQQTMQGVESKDTEGVYNLSFNRHEFLKVYPYFETDTSQERREFSVGFYLMDNRKTWLRILGNEGGRTHLGIRYEVEGPVINYKKMVLYKNVRIWVKRGDLSEEVRVIKSVAKIRSGWKIWSFTDS